MTINRINVTAKSAQTVEQIAQALEYTFRRNDAMQACIIADFPQISNNPVDFFIWLRNPFGKTGYRAGTMDDYTKRPWMNNMAFTIRLVDIEGLISINQNTITKKLPTNDEAEWNWQAERGNDQKEIEHFIRERTGLKYFFCPEIIWLKGYKKKDLCQPASAIPMVCFDDTITQMEDIINQVADEIMMASNFQHRFYSFPDKTDDGSERDMNALINIIIEAANQGSHYGILTKKKLDAITRLVQNTERILEAQAPGGKMCIITGKAGAGKTLAISRAMYEIAHSGKHARFLTYNRLLAIDMQQTLRALSIKVCVEQNQRLDSSNVSCQTIHQFFFNIAKRMNVLELVSVDRKKELQEACLTRINIAKEIFKDYLNRHDGQLPDNAGDIFLEARQNKSIQEADLKEIRNCLYAVTVEIKNERIEELSAEHIAQTADKAFQSYTQLHMERLANLAMKDVFKSDYYKVLEVLYAKMVQPEEFLYRQRNMNRSEFLNWVQNANPNASDKEIYSDTNPDDLAQVKEQIKSTRQLLNWSNTIFIDEGQDCNYYEKLIIQYLKKAENLVVATGGTDQLIRTPNITDWSKAFGGATLPHEDIKLGKQSHRQKSNIVTFANRVASLNNYSLELDADQELNGVGNIIIDTRPTDDGKIPNDIVLELKNNGSALGYSQYESLLFLLPITGDYVSRTSQGMSMYVDEDDNVTFNEDFGNQMVRTAVENVSVWSGVGESKSRSPFPQHDQSRFIYYESCRGLEACNLLCIDLDLFYEHKQISQEANRYVQQKKDLFNGESELRKRFATIWCTMVFTRAIDTLYIKLRHPNKEFGQTIIRAASEIPGTRIL